MLLNDADGAILTALALKPTLFPVRGIQTRDFTYPAVMSTRQGTGLLSALPNIAQSPHMASANSISADDIERLQSDGLLDVKDSGIGEQVQRMKDGRFPVRKAEGLNFCKRNILDDTVSRKHLL